MGKFPESYRHPLCRCIADACRGPDTVERRTYSDAISLINDVRSRAAGSTMLIFNYKEEYGVNFKVTPYELKANTQDEAMKMLKWERRIEFGMESSRFFDLEDGEKPKTLSMLIM